MCLAHGTSCAITPMYLPGNCLYLNEYTFTPNGDGKNEAFKPIIVAPAECWDFWEFKIYNRWGTLVFESNYPGQQWLGDSGRYPQQHYVPDGVYVWHLKARHRYGAWYDKHGHVTIFR